MSFLADVRQGRVGLRFPVPERLEIKKESDGFSMLVDPERRLVWSLHRSDYKLDLHPEHQDLLLGDIERHARDLFERCFQSTERPGGEGLEVIARTEDPEWSPVVEVERVRLGAAEALLVVHRMWYEPTRETVMGHLLVPLARGLFEFRVMQPAPASGVRESALTARILASSDNQGKDPMEIMDGIGQAYFDDPKHDAMFPEHPLSAVRAALRWLLEEGRIEVTDPPSPLKPGEFSASRAGFAVTPPPRYVRMSSGHLGQGVLRFSRMSFAVTEGVQILTVARLESSSSAVLKPQDLLRLAEMGEREAAPLGATRLKVEARILPGAGGRPHVRVYRAYDQEDRAPQHIASRWFVDEEGRIVMVSVASARCVPAEELFEQAEDVVRSFRLLQRKAAASAASEDVQLSREVPLDDDLPASRKPWWRFW